MSGKSGQRRAGRSRRNKPHQGSSPAAVTPAAVSPAAPPRAAAPAAAKHLPKSPATTYYPYVTTELKRIGILGGVMLAVLVVLALLLR